MEGLTVVTAARAGLLAFNAFWTWRFVTNPLNGAVIAGSFLHLVNLPFHEAGHIFFSPFGPFLMSLGGSLMQVIVPVVCSVALARRGDGFGASLCAWWTGQNFVDVAPYIADARLLQLPMLGGATGAEVEGHDWEAILQALGWLHRDRQLGMGAHVIGSVIMVAALAAAVVRFRDNRIPRPDAARRRRPAV